MSRDLIAIVPPVQQCPPLFPGAADPEPQQPGSGPSSNTGQKYPRLAEPIVDYLTIVLPPGALKKSGCHSYRELVAWIFCTGDNVVMGTILDRTWQFHDQSATLIDITGEVAGKIGFATKGDRNGYVCISLSGQGCKHLSNRAHTERVLEELGAHITRLDIAVDDLRGDAFDVRRFLDCYDQGDFISNGRPPSVLFLDDRGTNKGCTLYVGQKGHKQLCVYEKGKQLGDPTSDHVRCEVRLYAKHTHVPLSALTRLREFFAGSYPMLAEFALGEIARLIVREQVVNASATAMIRVVKQQGGRIINLLLEAFGEEFAEYVQKNIARHGVPARFKGTTGHLPSLVREQLAIRGQPAPGAIHHES